MRKILTFVMAIYAAFLFTGNAVAENLDSDQSPKASAEQTVALVNLNQASAETLAKSLKGIGLKKAQAIVALRESQGTFTSVDQITQVKGIGSKTLAKLRPFITVGASE
jgi:competence protein ComEA